MSRWEHWSRGSKPNRFFSDFLKEGPVDPVDGGNPSGSGVMTPGQRAKSMGLQSDGKGGYIDPKSGQKVAQTVNNELVFYSTAPGGGVTTDGAGGMQTARPSSAWQDPITGLMTVPPGKAETPQEIAAVPDPVPAQMPHGYANFIQQQKQIAYAQDAQQREMNKVLGQQPEQLPQPEMSPDASSTVAPDPAPMPQQEGYLPDELHGRMNGIPTPFHVLRDRMKSAQKVNPSPNVVAPGQSAVVDAIRNVPQEPRKGANASPNQLQKYETGVRKYEDNIVKAKDRANVESEREFDNPGAERQRRIDLDNSGFLGPDGDIDPEVLEFMQNAREGGEFQQLLKKQRARKARQTEDAKLELGGRDNSVISKNLFDPNRPDHKVNRPGGSTPAEREENAVLEALYHITSTGDRIQNLDGSYNEELVDLMKQHVGDKDDNIYSALKTARAIAEQMKSSGIKFDPDEYAFGKDGGQSTNIPDNFRSNLYDDILSDLVQEMAQFNPRYKVESTKRGRDKSVNNGHNAKEIEDMGKEMLKNIYGFDESSGGSLMDAIQSGDIYWNRRGVEDDIRGDIHKAAEFYRQLGDEMPDEFERSEEELADLLTQHPDLAGQLESGNVPNKFKQEIATHFMNEVRRQLGKRMESGDLIPQSLKKVNIPTDSKGNLQSEKAIYNPKISPENSSIDDVFEFVNQNFDDPGINLRFLQRMSNNHPYFGTNSMNFAFPATMEGRWTGQGLPDGGEDEVPTGVDKKKYADFMATMRSDSDAVKVEPTYSKGGASNLDARFGAAPMSYIQKSIEDALGYDFDHMIPRGGSGDRHTAPGDRGATQERFDDEHYEFWGNKLEEMMQDYEGSSALKLDPQELQIGDSGPLEPKEYIRQLFDIANLPQEDISGDETTFNRGSNAQQYDKYQSRKRVNGLLKNLHMLDWLRKADMDRDEQNPDGKLKKQFFEILARAGKLNTSVDNLSLPRWGIS